MRANRVVVIGIDGATWRILLPLVRKGVMPNIKKAIDLGFSCVLDSTIPPITGPAWMSLITGLGPGKTGVFDFLVRRKFEYDLHPISAKDYRGKAIWDQLCHEGLRVGLMNIPMLFPPYPVNGFMISGMGSVVEEKITYPKDLKDEIIRVTPGYKVFIRYDQEKYLDEYLLLSDLQDVLANRIKLTLHLLQNKEADFFMSIIQSTDWLQHKFWRHMDKNHPLYDPSESPEFARMIDKFWSQLDKGIGDVLDLLDGKANLFIVSDHGFGSQVGVFDLSTWMIDNGFMRLKKNTLSKPTEFMREILTKKGPKMNFLRKYIPATASRYLFEKIKVGYQYSHIMELIDFTKTPAFVLGHTIGTGGIYLNIKGREPNGLLDWSAAMDLRDELIKKLSHSIEETYDGSICIYKSEEIYSGPEAKYSPDIIFGINDWSCYITENKPSGNVFVRDSYAPGITGSHRSDGILIALGPDIRCGGIERASILDVVPTIAELYCLNSPKDYDGRVLVEMIDRGRNRIRPLPSARKRS